MVHMQDLLRGDDHPVDKKKLMVAKAWHGPWVFLGPKIFTENYQKDVPFKILASPKNKFAEYDIQKIKIAYSSC